MKIRIIALITLLAMMFTILTGCKPPQNDNGDSVVKPEAKLSLDKQNIELNIGETYQLKATISPNGDAATNVTWASTKTDVATVSGGLVTAVSKGVATISATTDNGLFATCYVIVKEAGDSGNQGNTPSVEVPDGTYDGSNVTITFYHTMSATRLQPILDLYIQEFNKLYPNIHIDHSLVGPYDDVFNQTKMEIACGNPPNIVYCYPDHVAAYNSARAVVSLDDLINSQIPVVDAQGNTTILGLTDEQKADFIPGFYAEGAVYDEAGTMYTLPMSKSTEALYYDKTFFEEHNLSVPTTWDEMEEVCAQLKALDPYCIPLGYDSEANWFITMCMQADPTGALYTQLSDTKDYFKFDNPTTRAFVERFKNWYDNGYVTTSELYGSYASSLFTNTSADFDGNVQRCYMVIASTGSASYHQSPSDADGNPEFETGIAMIPQLYPENPQMISQGPSLCIFKQSNPQEMLASWLFVEFLTTNSDFQAAFSMASNFAPVIQSAIEIPTYKNWLDHGDGYYSLAALSVKLALEQKDAYFTTAAFNGSSDARRQVGIIIVSVFGSPRTDIQALIDEEFRIALEKCKYAVN